MARKLKLPKTLRIEGYRVRLFERGGNGGASIYYSYQSSDGKRVVKSTKRTDAGEAEEYVKVNFAAALDTSGT